MTTKPTIKACGYVRVSTAIQVEEGESLTTQRQQITDYINAKGWELTKIYADEGLSGTKIEYRTEFQQMLKDAAIGKFSMIVFTKFSRFARNAREFQNLSYELEQNGVLLSSIKENIDPTTKTGKMISGILALFAEWEHETIREQMFENKMVRWRENRSFIGKPPFGYRWNKEKKLLEIESKESALYHRIISMYTEQGLSFQDIAIKLSAEGIKCKRAPFSSATLSYMLKNPAYYGNYVLNKHIYEDGKKGAGTKRTKELKPASETITFPIPSLISKAEWDRIQASTQFKKVKMKRGSEITPQFFLRDILVCERCGGKMNARIGSERKNGSYHRYYVCYWSGTSKKNLAGHHEKCTLPYIPAEKVENDVWADILVMFALNPKQSFGDMFDPAKNEERINELKQSILRLEAELSNKNRIRERLYKLLEYPDMDENELREKLRLNKDELLTIEGNLTEAKDKLIGLQEMHNKEKEFYDLLSKNKKHFSTLRKEIRNLSIADRKILVEAMLHEPIRIDSQEVNEFGEGGVQADYKLHINPAIIQRFVEEGKLTALDKNSSNYFTAVVVERGAGNNQNPFCCR